MRRDELRCIQLDYTCRDRHYLLLVIRVVAFILLIDLSQHLIQHHHVLAPFTFKSFPLNVMHVLKLHYLRNHILAKRLAVAVIIVSVGFLIESGFTCNSFL